MNKGTLRNANGEPLYYWSVNDKGIHFQFEFRPESDDPSDADMEVQFIMPHSEYYKVYEQFEIDATTPMENAIAIISDSGRGDQLVEALNEQIEVEDKFLWMN